MNQIYASQRQHLLLEVEVAPGSENERRRVAGVSVTYGDLKTRTSDVVSDEAVVTFTGDRGAAERAADRSVMVSAVELIANERNALAVSLRDRGEVQQAREVLRDNAAYLRSNSVQLDAPALEMLRQENETDADNLEGENWNRQRKSMRKKQLKLDMQQMY